MGVPLPPYYGSDCLGMDATVEGMRCSRRVLLAPGQNRHSAGKLEAVHSADQSLG